MNKIKYFSCLFVFFFISWACSDNDDIEIIRPEGITFGTVTDKAGNEYKTITIGKQTWLAENFRYQLSNDYVSEQVSYGEKYGNSVRTTLNGSDERAYRNYCSNWQGQTFILHLREKMFEAYNAGRLNTSSSWDAIWIIEQLENYSMPNLLSYGFHKDIEEELTKIWNEAVDFHLGVDRDYIAKYGYLYSYKGAQQAVKEGAPEGFHIPTDAEWMMLERELGMKSEELEGLENWRGHVGDLLKAGEQGIGFNALYGGAAVYALSTAYNERYVNKGEGAYFWCNDKVVVSDSLSNGMVRHLSLYNSGIRRMTSRLITSETVTNPSYSVRLVKTEK